MRFARSLLIFSYGLFSIAAQALLFREFITTFEGNDISVGVFFGSWFLWVGAAAAVIYKAPRIAEKLVRNIQPLFLLYIPAFVLQAALIIQAREIAGVQSYELLPIRTLLLLSFLINAPLSLITGILFPVACRWFQRTEKLPVSRVYILESAGSFAGGIVATVLLALGINATAIFLVLALVLSVSVVIALLAESTQQARGGLKAALSLLTPLLILYGLSVGADRELSRYIQLLKWTKLLPAQSLQGVFHTAQAEYLYGLYQGQFVVMSEGGVVEAVPDESTAGRTAAIALCQSPQARRILVIGSGLSLCRQLLKLPQIDNVTWTHCDKDYVRQVDSYLPDRYRIRDERFKKVVGDIRPFLTENKQSLDIVILNLPEATSSILNRYYTHQFYRQVGESLRTGGVLAVRVAGGENIMGTELVTLGASTKLTLEQVFSQNVLTPGEDTWFIASDSQSLTPDPGTLRDRFASIDGAWRILPSDALFSIYLPDRARKALESYDSADLPRELLVNTDSRPLTHLYSLLLASKQSGAPVTSFIKHLAMAGPLMFLIPLLVFAALRVLYLVKSADRGKPTGFDSGFLVFSAGSVGIGVSILLMYLYQTRYGSLYLHIGIISSLFMVGLTAGALLVSLRLAAERKVQPGIMLFVVVILHVLLMAAIAYWPSEKWTHLCFGLAFVLSGLCTGAYFPLASKQLDDCGFQPGQTGSRLETADHLGAAVGGVLTSLAVVPVLGVKASLLIFALLISANLPVALLRLVRPKRIYAPSVAAFNFRPLGYALFGLALTFVLCSNLLAAAARRLSPTLPEYAAQTLAGPMSIERVSAHTADRDFTYYKVYESNLAEPNAAVPPTAAEPAGYIFSSQDFAPQVRGFGGRINLALFVDLEGNLVDFHIIRSNETPAYLAMLEEWQDGLTGHNLFLPTPFADVDAVTGATVSSKAILSSLKSSACGFAGDVLGRSIVTAPAGSTLQAANWPEVGAIYLVAAFLLTLVVIWRGGFWTRIAVLCFNVAVGGVILNMQYSTEQIATLLSLQRPATGLSAAFLLIVGVPVTVLLFGNIYCGYICPFGAAQELIGYAVHGRGGRQLPRESQRTARFVKYAVLFVLVIAFFGSREKAALSADPLISVFGLRFSIASLHTSLLVITAIALLGSFFYTRFWCRYLCPVGAFLSLLNGAAVLKRYLPARRFGRCEFSVTAKDRLDCICCDKCRYDPLPPAIESAEPGPPTRRQPATLRARALIVGVLAVAAFVSLVSADRALSVIAREFDSATGGPAIAASGGQPRDVDMQRVRTMIRQKKLSDKEAEFYRQVE